MTYIINNTEPMPSIPQGASGRWEWDGHAIIEKGLNPSGQDWVKKGKWQWIEEKVAEDKTLKSASVEQIVTHYKPIQRSLKTRGDFAIKRIEKILYITSAIIITSTLILMLAL
jgi:hypothetical protein